MKKFSLVCAMLTISISGCSTPTNDPFVNEKSFKESNRPFLTVYQTERAQTTMLELDKTNDQVVMAGESEYVFWKHSYSTATDTIDASSVNDDEKSAEVVTNKNPFIVSEAMLSDDEEKERSCNGECVEESVDSTNTVQDEIIYNIGECHTKGCG